MKLDGYRMQVAVRQGRTTWFSRNGHHNWSGRLPDFLAVTSELPDCVLDGELCCLRPDGRTDFFAPRSAMGRREVGSVVGDLRFFAFDCLQHGAEDLTSQPLRARKEHLEALLFPGCEALSPLLVYVDPLEGDGPPLLEAACGVGLEGFVSKRLNAPYSGGTKRLDTWVKAKCRPSQEVVIGGWDMDGARFRSLLAGVWESDRLRYVGAVGTGFGAARVAELLPQLKAVEAERSPFTGPGAPRSSAGRRWARPDLVAAIEIAEWTASNRLRQASFKGLRQDKPARQVVRERPD